jgi:hypothetical protein
MMGSSRIDGGGEKNSGAITLRTVFFFPQVSNNFAALPHNQCYI